VIHLRGGIVPTREQRRNSGISDENRDSIDR
jgi:hypothetical protein